MLFTSTIAMLLFFQNCSRIQFYKENENNPKIFSALCGVKAPVTNLTANQNLCTQNGMVENFIKNSDGSWSWDCIFELTNESMSCGADVLGSCGESAGVSTDVEPAEGSLCKSGTATPLVKNNSWNWECLGSNGTKVQCSTLPSNPPLNNDTSGQTQPSNLTLVHSQNRRTFSVGWTAGTGNGDCRIEYQKKNSVWAGVSSPKTVSCDRNGSAAGEITLQDGDWFGGPWESVEVRLVRESDATVIGSFPTKLTCSNLIGSSVSTPNIDEDCDNNWDNGKTPFCMVSYIVSTTNEVVFNGYPDSVVQTIIPGLPVSSYFPATQPNLPTNDQTCPQNLTLHSGSVYKKISNCDNTAPGSVYGNFFAGEVIPSHPEFAPSIELTTSTCFNNAGNEVKFTTPSNTWNKGLAFYYGYGTSTWY